MYTRIVLYILSVVLLAGCKSVMQGLFDKQTPHEAYWSQIENAGLAESQMARQWNLAADSVLIDAVSVGIPFSEAVVFDYENTTAVAYSFSLMEGRNLRVEVEPEQADSSQVFIDLFRNDGEWELAAHAPQDSVQLTHQVKRDGDYFLRIQPELLTRGLFYIRIYSESSLAFPVPGKSNNSIASFFGDPRDGGTRQHEGVDVFAARGTPVVAASPGRVRRTGTNRLGGNVVWLSDRNNSYSYYYAHLDSQLVEPGVNVKTGDTLGLIGNTGNARTTPPHLHFGIYARGRGAVDPAPFFNQTELQEIPVEPLQEYQGEWGLTSAVRTNFRNAPELNSTVIQPLAGDTPLLIKGVSQNWLRVELPGGEEGFVHQSLVRIPLTETPYEISSEKKIVRSRPADDSHAIGLLTENSSVKIHSHYASYLLIEHNNRFGWIRQDDL